MTHWRKNWRNSNRSFNGWQLLGAAARLIVAIAIWWIEGALIVTAWLLSKLLVIGSKVVMALNLIAAILSGIRRWMLP
jgi:hypothetical protein